MFAEENMGGGDQAFAPEASTSSFKP